MTYADLLTPIEEIKVRLLLLNGWEIATLSKDGSRVDVQVCEDYFEMRKFPLFTIKEDR